MRKSNSIDQVVNYLNSNPFKTEPEIFEEVYGIDINNLRFSNKKYYELIRRGLRAKKIYRVEHKKGRCRFIYFTIPKNI